MTAKVSTSGTKLLETDGLGNEDSQRREFISRIRDIKRHSATCMEYYRNRQNDEVGMRFFEAFSRLHEHCNPGIEPGVEYLLIVAPLYDFDHSTPGNGYRSILTVIQKCSIRLMTLIRYIGCNRDSFLFRGDHYSREVESYVTVFGQLRACVYYLQKLVGYCQEGDLFPDEDNLSSNDFQSAEMLMGEVESLCQESFYGRCLGFQFCDSMVRPLTTINLVMASFSDGFSHSSNVMKFASSVLGSRKYFLDPDLRAQKVVEVTRNGSIEFCKAFWSLAENQLMHKMPLFVCPSVAVDRVIEIPPDPIEMPSADGLNLVTINPPCAHKGPGPVFTRLICYQSRVGQLEEDKKKSPVNQLPSSNGLIIHCHGGGFVAQSSASHEVYLRQWAKDINVPILCVDYSLAPEYPFPRQLEEVFFAYCWALKNSHLLGSTAERVCIVGDSAGGNLAVATALKALAYGIRIPDGVLSIYGSLLIKYLASPSRILSLMDPLLPLGVLPRCLGAYAGPDSVKESNNHVFTIPSESLDTEYHSNGTAYEISQFSFSDKNHSHVLRPQDEATVGKTGSILEDNFLEKSTGEDYKMNRNVGSNDSGFLELSASALNSQQNLNERLDETCTASSQESLLPVGQSTDSLDQNYQLTVLQSSPDDVDGSTAQVPPSTYKVPSEKPPRTALYLNLDSLKHRKGSSSLNRSTSSPTFITPVETPSSTQSYVSAGSSPPCFLNGDVFCTPTYAKMRHFVQSPVRQFKPLLIDRNPFMSPLYASDKDLQALCPVYLLTCHLDPMLDDSVTLAKRLRSVGTKTRLDILDGLPHGFLNFVLVSQDARKGSDLCIQRLKEILCLETAV